MVKIKNKYNFTEKTRLILILSGTVFATIHWQQCFSLQIFNHWKHSLRTFTVIVAHFSQLLFQALWAFVEGFILCMVSFCRWFHQMNILWFKIQFTFYGTTSGAGLIYRSIFIAFDYPPPPLSNCNSYT